MHRTTRFFLSVLLLTSGLFPTSCSTPGVQESRQSGVERRQDRIDSRTSSRLDRRQERGEREDARARARLDSW